MASQHSSIAVLGLGTMGAGMARSLCKAGFLVTVYNRNPGRAAPFAGIARIAATPAEAARHAHIVIAMLTDDHASEHVWLGASGAMTSLSPGSICMESSTVSTDWIARWSARVHDAGGWPLDAPVTGSKHQAETGALTFVVGGAADTVEAARPAMEAMGSSIVHLGDTGSGAMFKLINNFLGGAQAASLAEAIVMIERSGLDPRLAMATLAAGSPGSPMVKTLIQRILAEDFSANFQLRLQAKDIGYALFEASRMGVTMEMGTAAATAFDAAVDQGYGAQDIAAVIKSVRASRGD